MTGAWSGEDSETIQVAVTYEGNYALQFDGTDDYVKIPGNSAYAFGSGDFTIEMWINPTVLVGDHRVLFADHTLDNSQLDIGREYAGYRLEFYASGSGFMSGNLSWELGKWYHVAVPRISGTLKFFRDTVEVASGVHSNSVGNTAVLSIGFRRYDNMHPFNGIIDVVRIWNIGRTRSEIAASYNRTIDSGAPGLIGYFNFDEDFSQQSVYDLSSTENHGCLGANPEVGSDDPTRVVSTAPIIETTTARITLLIDLVGEDITFSVLDDTLAILNFSEEDLDSVTVIVCLGTLPPHTMPEDLWVHRFYSIIAYPGTGNFEASMTLFYDQAEFDSSGLPEEQNLQLYRYIDSTWTPQGGEPDAVANSLTLSGVTLFSYWAMIDPEYVGIHRDQTFERIPKSYALSQNYSNPFNATMEIKYALLKDCWVRLEVYNILGQQVATLVDGKQKTGYKTVRWDAGSLSSGIYFYRLQAGSFVETRKMILLK